MIKKRKGMRRFIPIALSVFVLTMILICAVLPAGAFELKADTLRDMQIFFEETEGDLALNGQTLADFAKDQLQKKYGLAPSL